MSSGARLSASEYLRKVGPKLFPFYFDTLLHPFLCSLLPLDADSRIAAVQKEFPSIVETILGPEIAQRLHDRTPAAPTPSGSPPPYWRLHSAFTTAPLQLRFPQIPPPPLLPLREKSPQTLTVTNATPSTNTQSSCSFQPPLLNHTPCLYKLPGNAGLRYESETSEAFIKEAE